MRCSEGVICRYWWRGGYWAGGCYACGIWVGPDNYPSCPDCQYWDPSQGYNGECVYAQECPTQ